ncbi:hypothetical protein B0T16DRAFT_384365 [Cercophora newfieldiana]|uniref:Uncharacterized protein n=1 Tax=Cercophora newfieldiana TaxID=92897 RepID=A0AA39YPQ4_9PEZI|nr:hypothetical protein B0T16DRAFT_384365 [Cercophora newfieldiana]
MSRPVNAAESASTADVSASRCEDQRRMAWGLVSRDGQTLGNDAAAWHTHVADAPSTVRLVNGAQGTVYDVCTDLRAGDKLAVPVLRVRQEFTIGRINCYREQFPLTVCYAITVHKSQGELSYYSYNYNLEFWLRRILLFAP